MPVRDRHAKLHLLSSGARRISRISLYDKGQASYGQKGRNGFRGQNPFKEPEIRGWSLQQTFLTFKAGGGPDFCPRPRGRLAEVVFRPATVAPRRSGILGVGHNTESDGHDVFGPRDTFPRDPNVLRGRHCLKTDDSRVARSTLKPTSKPLPKHPGPLHHHPPQLILRPPEVGLEAARGRSPKIVQKC